MRRVASVVTWSEAARICIRNVRNNVAGACGESCARTEDYQLVL